VLRYSIQIEAVLCKAFLEDFDTGADLKKAPSRTHVYKTNKQDESRHCKMKTAHKSYMPIFTNQMMMVSAVSALILFIGSGKHVYK
jgi:hypothetical protein